MAARAEPSHGDTRARRLSGNSLAKRDIADRVDIRGLVARVLHGLWERIAGVFLGSKPSSLRQIGPLEKSDPWQRRLHPWAIVRWRTIDIRVCISAPEIVGVAVLDFLGFVDASRSRNSAWEHGGNPSHVEWEAPALRTVHPSRSAESPSERAVQGVAETAPSRDKILDRWEGN
jgi:hypothetical protein